MSDPVTIVLGGICVAVVYGTVGKYIGSNDKVTEEHCGEKQQACQKLIITKIDNIGRKVDDLSKVVNNKLLGL